MNKLGIYFGPQGISIVESKLKKPVNYIHIPQSIISPPELLEEKVPEEVKVGPLIKDELIKKRIDSKVASLILSGKDLIVRTFEMPILPQEELLTAVSFEAKKYIPFKIEELFSDAQWKLDRPSRKNSVLFMGIKRETLDKYLAILGQLDLKINSIEYSAFSMLRFLNLDKIKEKGIIAIIDIDLMKNEEANFVVLENGFPLFSRDLTSISDSKGDFQDIAEEADTFGDTQSVMQLERLKREILVSLNYYERKFLGKNISKIFFVVNPNYQSSLAEVFKDISLPIKFIDVNRLTEQFTPFSLSFIKAYSGSLQGIETGLKIDLLSAKGKISQEARVKLAGPVSLITLILPYLKAAFVCALICVIVFIFSAYRATPLRKELAYIISIRPKLAIVGPKAGIEELNSLNTQYTGKTNTLDSLFTKQKYLTPLLDTIPRIVPKGLWLNSFSIQNNIEADKISLSIEGMAYLEDSNKERELVNQFLSLLKEAPLFIQYFKEIDIVTLDRRQSGNDSVTNFLISCRN